MVRIIAVGKTLHATLEQAVEGILGNFADKGLAYVDLEYKDPAIVLTTHPQKLTYTFQPESTTEKIFENIAFGYAMWTMDHAGRKKPSLEELTHAIVATKYEVDLSTIIVAKLTIRQLARLIVLSVGPNHRCKSFEHALQEARRS